MMANYLSSSPVSSQRSTQVRLPFAPHCNGCEHPEKQVCGASRAGTLTKHEGAEPPLTIHRQACVNHHRDAHR